MGHPVQDFVGPDSNSSEAHAVAKAIRTQPRVVPIGVVNGRRYYEVTSSRSLGQQYPVRVWANLNGDLEIECYCKAATPDLDPATGQWAYVPKPCYHQAAVLIYESMQEG